MTGVELKKIQKDSGLNPLEFANKIGISRANLYKFFDLKEIDNYYVNKINNASKKSTNSLPLIPIEAMAGLRFGDLVKFTTADIKNNVIKIKQQKTGGVVSIPIIPQAKALLPETKFKVLTNQKSNSNLKEIQKAVNINVKMSCHVARHTFATIGLNSGVPLEVVSEVLGHSSTRVTKIYAKMLDDYKTKALECWGK